MKPLLQTVLYCGFSPDIDREVMNKIMFFNIIVVVYTLTIVPFVIVLATKKNYMLGSILVAGLLILFGMRTFMCITKKYQICFILTAVMMIFIYLSNYITGGTNNNGPLWYFTFPMMALILLGPLKGSLASISLIAISLILLIGPFNKIMMTVYEPDFLVRFFISYSIVFILGFVYEIQKQRTREEIKELKGFLPICSNCKKIRDDEGYWNRIEIYITDRTKAKFSHSICPECAKKLYPDLDI